jgi:hypothetical protein
VWALRGRKRRRRGRVLRLGVVLFGIRGGMVGV